jgi:hypothetical protein
MTSTELKGELALLRVMKTSELLAKYREVFQEESPSRHRERLIRRIAWRIQALAEGDLSERARRRAEEIANDADLRIRMPSEKYAARAADPERETVVMAFQPSLPEPGRLPMPGALIIKEYHGRQLRVMVLDDGFEFDGQRFRSLSAIARHITGTQWNGNRFFGIAGKGGAK